MLRMYAVWIEGATGADIQAIRNAMDGRGIKLSVEKAQKKVAERVGFEPT